MKQVYLYQPMTHWANVTSETETHIIATALDGVTVYVVKDGQERLRDAKP